MAIKKGGWNNTKGSPAEVRQQFRDRYIKQLRAQQDQWDQQQRGPRRLSVKATWQLLAVSLLAYEGIVLFLKVAEYFSIR